jgi:hypothetical protein
MPYIDNYLVPIDATSDQNNWLDRLTAALERMESSSFYFSRKLSDDKRAVKVEIGKDRSRKIDISIPIGPRLAIHQF